MGIAPFYSYKFRLLNLVGYTGLRILADHATGLEYGDWLLYPSCEQEALAAITETLNQLNDQWDVIWMPRMSGWTGAIESINNAARAAGMLTRSRPSAFSYIPLPDSIEKFENSFSTKRRRNMRADRRKILSYSGVKINQCRSIEQLPMFLEALFSLHHRRRMLVGDPGCFIRKPAEADFYRHFTSKAFSNGWLRFFTLTHDNEVQAVQIGYVYRNIFHSLQEGFNPDYIKRVGNVLRYMVINECINEGITVYDFLGSFSEHKRLWKAQERDGYDLLVAHPSIKNKLLFIKDIWPTGHYIDEYGLFEGN